MKMNEKELKTYCKINLSNLAYNYNKAKANISGKVICVVKANAYGHGAKECALHLQKQGCDFFAVSSFEEALELRDCGITGSVLILGAILPCQIKDASEKGIILAVGSEEYLDMVYTNLPKNSNINIHIKLNTGMNRTGFNVIDGTSEIEALAKKLKTTSNIRVCGIFSHFACSESDRDFTLLQYQRFCSACDCLKNSGIDTGLRHICNSEGAFLYPEMQLDAVRCGIHLYGCDNHNSTFKPVMEFATTVMAINKIYGLNYVAKQDAVIAVIGAGYGDGFTRQLSGKDSFVLYNNVKCPILGNICMDMAMIDISNVKDAKIGDKVILWNKDLPCEVQAEKAGTISYELICGVSHRVPRIYTE